MSTDRELLELAAKANGFQVKGWIGDRLSFFDPILDSAEYEWNPLADDGDALRLAARLSIGISFSLIDGSPTAYRDRKFQVIGCQESAGNDVNAATRRAIVRAAAEIGRSMP